MISRGQGRLGTIYERLRKRSYRGRGKWSSGTGRKLHRMYVKGVRDALKEVEQQGVPLHVGQCGHEHEQVVSAR